MPRRILLAPILLALTAAAAVAGCSSDDHAADHADGHTDHVFLTFCDLPQVCKDIVVACHPKDDGTAGKVHDCHETAHDEGDEAGCAAIVADCVATCNAAPVPGGGPSEELDMSCGDAGAMDGGM